MSWGNRNHALRTVKGGAVKIRGRIFRPKTGGSLRPYAGELDGQRFAFSLYYLGKEWRPEFVALWGSEASYRWNGEGDDPDWPGANCIDGVFHWGWWESEGGE